MTLDPPYFRRRGFFLFAAASLVAYYAVVAWLTTHPRVEWAYRLYYVERRLVTWPKSGSLAYRLGEVLDFSTQVRYQSRIGWSSPESWGTWTSGPEASLFLDLGGPIFEPLLVKAKASGFTHEKRTTRLVDVIANDKVVATWSFVEAEGVVEREAVLPPSLLGRGRLELTFRVLDPEAPRSVGAWDDSRPIGLGMSDLVIQRQDGAR